jgi:exopolysaccharide biosynthesis polyprenyl glycosylphosphotransferase
MQVHELMDACIFAVSFWIAYNLRADPRVIELLRLEPVEPFDRYVWLYLVLIPLGPMILEAQGFYSRPMLCPRAMSAWILFKGCAITSLSLIIALFLFRSGIARWAMVWFGGISFALIMLKEEILLAVFKSRLAQSQYRRRFLLVGSQDETKRLIQRLKGQRYNGIEIIGEFSLEKAPIEKLVEMLHEHSACGIILSSRHTFLEQVEAAIQACELEGVEVWLIADFFRTQISCTSLDEFCGQPVMVFRSAPEASWQGILKQAIDLFGAMVLLLISGIPLLIVAFLIRLTSPGPVLFRQQRSGLNGRPFTIYKFRTMVTNAEQYKHELAAMNEMTGPVFKVSNDPRITPFGRILRKYSIDEFPQLLNVICGEMSLVGPRPLPVDETKSFNDLAHRRRLSVKPGLTCLWQISGRNNVSDFKEWVRLDLQYIDNWSIWLDIKILVRTIPVVLLGTGAK